MVRSQGSVWSPAVIVELLDLPLTDYAGPLLRSKARVSAVMAPPMGKPHSLRICLRNQDWVCELQVPLEVGGIRFK